MISWHVVEVKAGDVASEEDWKDAGMQLCSPIGCNSTDRKLAPIDGVD